MGSAMKNNAIVPGLTALLTWVHDMADRAERGDRLGDDDLALVDTVMTAWATRIEPRLRRVRRLLSPRPSRDAGPTIDEVFGRRGAA